MLHILRITSNAIEKCKFGIFYLLRNFISTLTFVHAGFLSMLMLLMAGTSTGLLVDTTDMCDILRVIDCNHHYHSNGDETVCCTDGKTYKNKYGFYFKKKINSSNQLTSTFNVPKLRKLKQKDCLEKLKKS